MDIGRLVCLLLVLAGLVFPVRRFAAWFASGGDWEALALAVTASEPARGMTDALVIVSTTAVVFMVAECRARRDRSSPVAIPATTLLGPAVGLPLYLYLRLRPLA